MTLAVLFSCMPLFAASKSSIKSVTELALGAGYKVVFTSIKADKDDIAKAKAHVTSLWKSGHGNIAPKKIETLVPIGLDEPTVVFIFHK
jgi:hypothetical protein